MSTGTVARTEQQQLRSTQRCGTCIPMIAVKPHRRTKINKRFERAIPGLVKLKLVMKRHASATAIMMLLALGWVSAGEAYSYKVLYRFKGGEDGALPAGRLLLDKSGNLWGSTVFGGGGKCPFGNAPHGCGTIFRITPDGKEAIIVAFSNRAMGFQPDGGLLANATGTMYGTTFYGGIHNRGTVFKLSSDGEFSQLYEFGGWPDAKYPLGGLVMRGDSALYGASLGGGKRSGGVEGCGTVFELSLDGGAEKVVHEFSIHHLDGCNPDAPVITDQAGNIYGTAYQGGAHGAGMVFKINSNGTESALYSFLGGADGRWPTSPLAEDSSGNLYGGTNSGGPNTCGGFINNCGVLYRITPDGSESIVYAFKGPPDGWDPNAGILVDGGGNLYGTTAQGGSAQCDCGIAYKIAPDGTETILHTFGSRNDGMVPTSQLIMDAEGTFYGVTEWGGHTCAPNTCGTVFEIKK